MSEPGSPAATPRVGVYALVGHGDRLLVVEYPEHDALPGGAVQAGEPVEQALRRMLLDQLGATIAELDFCAVIEHGATESRQPPESEVAFLFDVTLTRRDLRVESTPQPHRWAGDHELSSLRPPGHSGRADRGHADHRQSVEGVDTMTLLGNQRLPSRNGPNPGPDTRASEVSAS